MYVHTPRYHSSHLVSPTSINDRVPRISIHFSLTNGSINTLLVGSEFTKLLPLFPPELTLIPDVVSEDYSPLFSVYVYVSMCFGKHI